MARSKTKKTAPTKRKPSVLHRPDVAAGKAQGTPKKPVLHQPDVSAGKAPSAPRKAPRRPALHEADVRAGQPKAPPRAAKAPPEPTRAAKTKAPPKRGKRKRDYKKEYARRVARAEVIQRATNQPFSRSVARGHPRREQGEIGLKELTQLQRAVRLPSIGQQRAAGETNPVQFELRVVARARIAELAGISIEVPTSTKASRRNADAEKFVETFIALGLGTLYDAYTLYFSP